MLVAVSFILSPLPWQLPCSSTRESRDGSTVVLWPVCFRFSISKKTISRMQMLMFSQVCKWRKLCWLIWSTNLLSSLARRPLFSYSCFSSLISLVTAAWPWPFSSLSFRDCAACLMVNFQRENNCFICLLFFLTSPMTNRIRFFFNWFIFLRPGGVDFVRRRDQCHPSLVGQFLPESLAQRCSLAHGGHARLLALRFLLSASDVRRRVTKERLRSRLGHWTARSLLWHRDQF